MRQVRVEEKRYPVSSSINLKAARRVAIAARPIFHFFSFVSYGPIYFILRGEKGLTGYWKFIVIERLIERSEDYNQEWNRRSSLKKVFSQSHG